MKLSVVILNYNVKYFIDICLQSVCAAHFFIGQVGDKRLDHPLFSGDASGDIRHGPAGYIHPVNGDDVAVRTARMADARHDVRRPAVAHGPLVTSPHVALELWRVGQLEPFLHVR